MAYGAYDIKSLGYDEFLERSNSLYLFDPQETTPETLSFAKYDGGLSNLDDFISPQIIGSGSLAAVLFHGKQTFTDTTAGYRWGVDDTDGTYKWIMGNGTNSIDWNVTTANVLTVIGAISASTIDIGGSDATSFHVDIDGNMWLGAATFAAAPASISNAGVGTFTNVTITGASSSIAGNALVGSWTANSSSLTNTSGGNTVTLSTGATAFLSGPTGSPTFTVTAAGAVTATSGTIAGWTLSSTDFTSTAGGNTTIVSSGATSFTSGPTGAPTFTVTQAGAMTATSGLIGAWTINASTLTGGDATLDPAGDLTLGTGNNLVRLSATDATYRIWAGHATASAAPFSVTQGGILRATNAEEIVLTVQDTGNVVGLIVTQSDVTNNPVGVSITQNGTGDILNIFDGAVETFTILGNGRTGIYQGTPTAVLEVVQTSALTTGSTLLVSRNLAAASTDSPVVSIIQDNATDDQVLFRLQQDGSGDILNIFDGATEVFTILDGGDVGIGTTSPTNTLNVETTAGGIIAISRDRSASAFDGAGWHLGTLAFGGQDSDSGEDNDAVQIVAQTDGAWTASSHPTRMIFSTTPSGATSVTERMRIDSAGVLTLSGTLNLDSVFDIDSGTGANAIDTTATTSDAITITGSSLTTGDLVRIYSNSADTNTRYLLEVTNDNALATGAVNLFLQQDGGNAHIRFIGDPANSSPTDGDLTYTGAALNFYDGTRTRDLLSLWEQIGETTLGGAATSVSVASLPARQHLRIVIYVPSSSGSIDLWLRFNNDSGTNYAYNSREGGAAGGGANAQAQILLNSNSRTFAETIYVLDVYNTSAGQKLVTGSGYTSGGTNQFGFEYINTGHWNNTASQITRVDVLSSTASTLAANTRITVYAKPD